MRIIITRLSAVVLTLALVAGNLAVCAAWVDSPEARMACCADEDQCPMHESDSPPGTANVTQSDADNCCFLGSGSSQPSSQSPTFVPLVSLAPLPACDAPAPVSNDARPGDSRTLDALQAIHVPRHLLISVLLV